PSDGIRTGGDQVAPPSELTETTQRRRDRNRWKPATRWLRSRGLAATVVSFSSSGAVPIATSFRREAVALLGGPVSRRSDFVPSWVIPYFSASINNAGVLYSQSDFRNR